MNFQTPKHKYGTAKKTEYNGVVYSSKFEAQCAIDLDMRMAAGDVLMKKRAVDNLRFRRQMAEEERNRNLINNGTIYKTTLYDLTFTRIQLSKQSLR